MKPEPRTLTFIELMQARNHTAGVLLVAIKMTGIRGRNAEGTRVWTERQAKEVLDFADATIRGVRFA